MSSSIGGSEIPFSYFEYRTLEIINSLATFCWESFLLALKKRILFEKTDIDKSMSAKIQNLTALSINEAAFTAIYRQILPDDICFYYNERTFMPRTVQFFTVKVDFCAYTEAVSSIK